MPKPSSAHAAVLSAQAAGIRRTWVMEESPKPHYASDTVIQLRNEIREKVKAPQPHTSWKAKSYTWDPNPNI